MPARAAFGAIYSGAMASKKAYLENLRRIPMFSGCTNKELERLARAGDEIDMEAGTLLADQGQTGREAFVVLEGSVSVRRNGRKVATLGPGAIVGELSLLDHGPRTATVVCDTDVKVWSVGQTWTISPTLIWDATFGYNNMKHASQGPDFGTNVIVKVPQPAERFPEIL